MKFLSWLSIPAILLTFIFIVVPGMLWLVDKGFSKLLEQKLFVAQWNKWGIAAALIFWILEYFF